MHRVNVNDLVIGKLYFVECGMWSGRVVYTHSEKRGTRTYYNFTFGRFDNWLNQFNIYGCKSKLKIYEI